MMCVQPNPKSFRKREILRKLENKYNASFNRCALDSSVIYNSKSVRRELWRPVTISKMQDFAEIWHCAILRQWKKRQTHTIMREWDRYRNTHLNIFFGATLRKSNSERTKHGQMRGREKYFARNTTSSQSIYLQNLASIQPRTSPFKFARSPRTDPPGFQEQARKSAIAE